MHKELQIRSAAPGDAAAIAALAGQLGYPSKPDAVSRRILRIVEHSDQLLVIAQLDQICGWLQAHAACVVESGFRVEILGLVVSAQNRRLGIGRRLVNFAEEWATGIGAEVIVVRSNVARVESHLFYSADGYTLTKTQTVYRKMLSSNIAAA